MPPSNRNTPSHALQAGFDGGDSILNDVLTSIQASTKVAAKYTAPSEKSKKVIASMSLQRVAGNMYECPSTRDFWQVTADGGIRRLAEDTKVDNGEHLQAADHTDPEQTLNTILADLTL